jgi:hypothetical protein
MVRFTHLRIIAVILIVVLGARSASAGVVDNLALNKPVTHTTDSEVWAAANFTDGESGNAANGIWHFGGSYATTIDAAQPYFGAVDIAGANNTVSIQTIRLIGTYSTIGGAGQSPRALTVQSRNVATNPLDATVDSGWTNTGMSFTGATHINGSYTLPNAINTRALRVRITERNLTNDRLAEIEAFSVDPHARSIPHQLGIDPVLSRSDNVPLVGITNISSLRDNNFDLANRPAGSGLSLTDAVMNYDYNFGLTRQVGGVRVYFADGSVTSVNVQVPDGLGGWLTIPGGVQTNPTPAVNGSSEIYYFDFQNSAFHTQFLRIRTTVNDINGDPRSTALAGEIEIYIPEPASAMTMLVAGLPLMFRRRRSSR